MNKIDLAIGVVIGILSALLGSFLFIVVFTDYSFFNGITMMKMNGYLGKIITIGAVLNLILFFVLLKFNKELMARGVVLATIILAVITLFV